MQSGIEVSYKITIKPIPFGIAHFTLSSRQSIFLFYFIVCQFIVIRIKVVDYMIILFVFAIIFPVILLV